MHFKTLRLSLSSITSQTASLFQPASKGSGKLLRFSHCSSINDRKQINVTEFWALKGSLMRIYLGFLCVVQGNDFWAK